MSDLELERLLRGGLASPTGVTGESQVQININGKMEVVPAAVGTYMALSNLNAIMQQVLLRLDGLHAHASASAHPNSKAAKACPVCTVENLTPEQVTAMREEMERMVAKDQAKAETNVDAIVDENTKVHPDISTEEERETSNE